MCVCIMVLLSRRWDNNYNIHQSNNHLKKHVVHFNSLENIMVHVDYHPRQGRLSNRTGYRDWIDFFFRHPPTMTR